MLHNINKTETIDIDIFSKQSQKEINMMPEDFPIVSASFTNKNYLIGNITGASGSEAYYTKYDSLPENLIWKPLYQKDDQIIEAYIENNEFLFLTAKNAENYTIAKTNLLNPDFANPEILVTEKVDEVIRELKVVNNGFYYITTKNGVSAKLYFNDYSKEKEIELPEKFGSLSIESTVDNTIWISGMGWTTPLTRYKYDADTEKMVEISLNQKKSGLFQDYVIEEKIIEARDKKQIPLSIIYKNGTRLNSANKALMYAYGAYGTTIRPFFSIDWLSWVENGGVLCFAHVRGGGEKGNNWYIEGFKEKKHNSWNDLIDCSKFLIDNKYTSKEKLSIYGGSAGGITIGRAATERPDLFGSVIIEVGMLNTLRLEQTPNGLNSAKEFGSTKDSLECLALIEMDSYHNIKQNTEYPATLVIVGMNDMRVSPWQSGKFVARLQEFDTSQKPIIFFVDYDEGHYFNSSRKKVIEKMANIFSFAYTQTE